MAGYRPRLDSDTAAVRSAVAASLSGLPEDSLVLSAVSGGADSLALASASVFVGERQGIRVGAIIVDHGLQEGSELVAERTAALLKDMGLHPVIVCRVEVEAAGQGPEAAARAARYAAFDEQAKALDAVAVLVAHTLDDQAETVLLGLARGSGTNSLAGMRPRTVSAAGVTYLRPLLGQTRTRTEAVCAAAGLTPWRDPHNDDPVYARVRVRKEVLPMLEQRLDSGIRRSLVRTAELLQADAEVLDGLATDAYAGLVHETLSGIECDLSALAAQPRAIRTRLYRLVVHRLCSRSLTFGHAKQVDALVTDWHGQKRLTLPGATVVRSGNLMIFTATGDTVRTVQPQLPKES